MRTLLCRLALFLTVLHGWRVPSTHAGEPLEYKVEIKDFQVTSGEILLPLDSTVRIRAQHGNNIYFGLTVDNVRITCSPQGSVWPSALIDGRMHNPASVGGPVAITGLTAAPHGKLRQGFVFRWNINKLAFTQTVEVVPSRPPRTEPGARRKLDTCRISYLVENKDTQPHEVAFRTNIDILINANDGALYASPTTAPGKILNGVMLQDKTLPSYLHVLERPDLKNPGFVATMTFNFGARVEGPSKVVLTQLGALGAGAWEIPAVPAGDSGCAMYWPARTLKPGEKREMVWAYGGGIATSPESEGKVSLTLGGNLEPGKLFTLAALVEDPVPGQSLKLELPPGIVRVEGSERQSVPTPSPTGNSFLLWKGSVLRPGQYDLKVHSSTGVTRIKSVSIQPLGVR